MKTLCLFVIAWMLVFCAWSLVRLADNSDAMLRLEQSRQELPRGVDPDSVAVYRHGA